MVEKIISAELTVGRTCKTAIAVITILKLWFSKVASYLLL